MSDKEDSEPEETEEPTKSIFDKITKKHVDNFLESLFIIAVALLFVFFYPLIKYCVLEGLALTRCYYNPPVGHGKPLGGHVAPETTPIKKLTDWPKPIGFFDDYVSESKPVIFQGLASRFPAYELWTDEYFRLHAASEKATFKNKTGQYDSNSTLDIFLETYQKERVHLYTKIPERLKGDVLLPAPIQCGNFPASIAETVIWMNGGNLTLGLNAEVLDGLHCSLRGKQIIVLVDRRQHENARMGVTESLEERNIDLCWNRALQRLTWFNVTLETGDCIYIPSRWYKEIIFEKVRSLGVSFRFFRLLYFNQSNCEEQLANTLPNDQPNQELLKYEIISLSENHATLDIYTFQKVFKFPGINDDTSLKKLFTLLDSDGDNEILPEDMYSMETQTFLSFFTGYRTNDTLRYRSLSNNTPDLQYQVGTEL